MPVSTSDRPARPAPSEDGSWPVVIQGGMGVAVSSWQMARAVSQAGQLGVVSGTALDVVIARRLQDGDANGDVRRALANFPVPAMAERVLNRHFREGGRAPGESYVPVHKLSMSPSVTCLELSIVANFAEVWLAKEGHHGVVGINFLEKVQMATPSAAYGAMLAGVDYVLMGAGIPSEIPQLLNHLALHEKCSLDLDVDGATTAYSVGLDPEALTGGGLAPLPRPHFLAIVSAHVLAAYLAREDSTRPDGFVVEGPRAGGHNAPPRGRLVLDADGQPVFGPRDDADRAQVAAVGLPFWLAGGSSTALPARQACSVGVPRGLVFTLVGPSGPRASCCSFRLMSSFEAAYRKGRPVRHRRPGQRTGATCVAPVTGPVSPMAARPGDRPPDCGGRSPAIHQPLAMLATISFCAASKRAFGSALPEMTSAAA